MKFNYKTVIITTALVALTNPLMVSASLKTLQSENSEIVINYHLSELNSAVGLARIKTQVRQASRKVCGKVSRTQASSLRIYSASKACYNNAVERAMGDLNDLAFTRSHERSVISAY